MNVRKSGQKVTPFGHDLLITRNALRAPLHAQAPGDVGREAGVECERALLSDGLHHAIHAIGVGHGAVRVRAHPLHARLDKVERKTACMQEASELASHERRTLHTVDVGMNCAISQKSSVADADYLHAAAKKPAIIAPPMRAPLPPFAQPAASNISLACTVKQGVGFSVIPDQVLRTNFFPAAVQHDTVSRPAE